MSKQYQVIINEVKIGSPATFQTIISIKGGHAPHGNVELKVETLFGQAKIHWHDKPGDSFLFLRANSQPCAMRSLHSLHAPNRPS